MKKKRKSPTRNSPTGKIECKLCGMMVPMRKFKEKHGKRKPFCVYRRTWTWCYDHEWRPAGRDRRVLELAGVTKELPVGRPFYWVWTTDPETKKTTYVWQEAIVYETCAPNWAIEMARKLMDDQAMVERFGIFRREKRNPGEWQRRKMAKAGLAIDPHRKMVIPVQMRAKIIRVAAQSAITREMFDDDLDAALTIIRDAL